MIGLTEGTPADSEVALRLFQRLCPDSDELRMIVIPGEPKSKARPRFTRSGRTYHAPADKAGEARTAAFMRSSVRSPYTGNVALGCVFYRPNRQRIDVDNMLKHVCDAANGVLWVDDSQVTAVMGVAELDSDRPRTVIVIGRHVSTLSRGTDATVPCERCGGPISLVGGKTARRRFCSRACATGARTTNTSTPCAQCGNAFIPTSHRQKLCSPACRTVYIHDTRHQKGQPLSKCSSCGKTLTHRRGGRCRECWRKDPRTFSTVKATV